MIIIHSEQLQQKINNFMQENNITQLHKDPTELYQKKIQQAVSKISLIISKNSTKTGYTNEAQCTISKCFN